MFEVKIIYFFDNLNQIGRILINLYKWENVVCRHTVDIAKIDFLYIGKLLEKTNFKILILFI